MIEIEQEHLNWLFNLTAGKMSEIVGTNKKEQVFDLLRKLKICIENYKIAEEGGWFVEYQHHRLLYNLKLYKLKGGNINNNRG